MSPVVPLLEARGLTRNKPGGGFLLDDIHLAIGPSERVAIVGPSGAGKTLLLRALAMLDAIDAGELLWRGQSVACGETPAFRAQVIYLNQRPAILEGTVEDNLRLPFSLAVHRERRFDRDRAIHGLEQFGRGAEFLQKRDRELSGGESQIVALLRVLQLEPTVLLLDEPTSALDPETVLIAERLVDEWRGGERSAVWVSHDAEQGKRVAGRIVGVDRGRVNGGGAG